MHRIVLLLLAVWFLYKYCGPALLSGFSAEPALDAHSALVQVAGLYLMPSVDGSESYCIKIFPVLHPGNKLMIGFFDKQGTALLPKTSTFLMNLIDINNRTIRFKFDGPLTELYPAKGSGIDFDIETKSLKLTFVNPIQVPASRLWSSRYMVPPKEEHLQNPGDIKYETYQHGVSDKSLMAILPGTYIPKSGNTAGFQFLIRIQPFMVNAPPSITQTLHNNLFVMTAVDRNGQPWNGIDTVHYLAFKDNGYAKNQYTFQIYKEPTALELPLYNGEIMFNPSTLMMWMKIDGKNQKAMFYKSCNRPW